MFLSSSILKKSIPLPTFLCLIASISFSQAEEAVLPKKHAPFIEKYCFECHDSLTEEGKVNLEDLAFQINTLEGAELWQKVLNAMNSGKRVTTHIGSSGQRKATCSSTLA